MEKISVAVRVRPPTSEDSSRGTYWKVDGNCISLHKALGSAISGLSFAFDHVFDERCTNATIYELLTKDIIHAAVEGFNGTAFAYGQTSSGKTFTMNGSETDPGIIHRAVKDIFEKIKMMSDQEFLIRVSYMEIYNEEINDLFAVENQKLQIHESLERGIYVAGLREEIVSDAEQVLKLIRTGEVNRHFGETNMNVKSSRSHTIFRMVIESKGKETISCTDYSSTDVVRVSVLNLVDLAGSERIAKTGAGGVRLKEGKHINKSLMVLGNVINKLSDGARQRGHVPYRDSKLTRILQPALGGNAKTSIICTVAPEEIHTEETKGTLQFASRAKHITNCVQVNEILTDTALLKRQKLEIEGLRKKLEGSHTEVLEQEVLKLRNDLLKYEVEREMLEMELQEEKKKQNLSNLITNSESDYSCSRGSQSGGLTNECPYSDKKCQGDAFTTPCFKSAPDAFVVKRSNNHTMLNCSPISETFTNIADEDTWLKMNNGHVVDLDFLQTTPARKVQVFPSNEKHPVFLSESSEQEIQNLQRQVEVVLLEKNELEMPKNNISFLLKENVELLSSQIVGERSNFQQKAIHLQETSHGLCESLKTCKDIFHDVFSTTQSLAPDRKSSSAKFLSCTSEICESIFTALEAHFAVTMGDQLHFKGSACLLQEENKLFRERLKSAITTIIAETSTISCNCSKMDKVLDIEDRRRKDLEEGVKQLVLAFTHRQNVLTSLSREVTSKVEKLRAQKPISQLNSREC